MYQVSATLDNSTGKYKATLAFEGSVIDSAADLKDVKAVNAWADSTAAQHKWENQPQTVETYTRTFPV